MAHSANTALLINGPCKGQKPPISPGQRSLEVVEAFDYDQGRTRKFHGYEYEKPLMDNDRMAIFVHRKSWQESTVDQ